MEVGKLYKSNMGGLVVFCTAVLDDEFFSGVVVDSGNTGFNIGFVDYEGNRFLRKSFEEYTLMTQAQVLTNGHTYNIPDGCKATIENGVVLIESNVKYYKESCVGCKMYFRVEGNKMVKIEIYPANSKAVFFIDGLINIDCKEECSESEFMEVYNSIVKLKNYENI